MRVFKSTYKTGRQTRQTETWYVEFRDHDQQVRRMAGFTSKSASEELGRKVEDLVANRISGASHDPRLARWINDLPAKLKTKLVKLDLLDSRTMAAGKPLTEHLEDFKTALAAKGNTKNHVDLVYARVKRILRGTGFITARDISPSKLQAYLAGQRREPVNMSAQTSNFYLTCFKHFCRWMHVDGRAGESPVSHLRGLNVKTDRRHDRRAMNVQEMLWLLQTTEKGPARSGVSGKDRALVYRFAAETGLRANEIRTLTIDRFNLDTVPPTVRVLAAYSKHRSEDVIMLKKEMASLLKLRFANKAGTLPAFVMPSRSMLARALKADLEAARDAWLKSLEDEKEKKELTASDFLVHKDKHGRYVDFHALRHVTGSFLAAAGVTAKVAQSIMRHSDYRLTMNTYSHSFHEDEVQAIEKIPDLSARKSKDDSVVKTA